MEHDIRLERDGLVARPALDSEWTIGGNRCDWDLDDDGFSGPWARLSYMEGWRIRTVPPAQISLDGVKWLRAVRLPLGESEVHLVREGHRGHLSAVVGSGTNHSSAGPSGSDSAKARVGPGTNGNSPAVGIPPAPVNVDLIDPTSTAAARFTSPRVWRSIGRLAECDVQVVDDEVDDVHARFQVLTKGSIEIRDNRSKLGTFVNGISVSRAKIGDGGTLQVGSVTLVNRNGVLAVRRAAGNERPIALRVELDSARYSASSGHGLSNVLFELPEKQVFAIIGPSGAGKSTLLAAMLGELKNIRINIDLNGSHINGTLPYTQVSFVPQADSLPAGVSVYQTLDYVAKIRTTLSSAQRATRIEAVVARLGLSEHVHKDALHGLSGGQRKRTSVAMELLSNPSILLLDEPTSGLDEGLDRKMMKLLAETAQGGTAVLVITHSMANLGTADGVIALNSRGTLAFAGRPELLRASFGASSHADVMDALHDGRSARGSTLSLPPRQPTADSASFRGRGMRSELWSKTLFEWRRFFKWLPRGGSGAGSVVSLWQCIAPFVVQTCLIPLLVAVFAASASSGGLGEVGGSPNPKSAVVLSVLVIATSFFATALTTGELVRDGLHLVRERRWLISTSSMIWSKFAVYGVVAVVQGATCGLFYILFAEGPRGSGGINGASALIVTLVLLSAASSAFGLLVSAASSRVEFAMIGLMFFSVLQVMFSGLLIRLGGSGTTAALSLFLPTRWAASALASSVDLNRLSGPDVDLLWTADLSHVTGSWLALLALTLCALVVSAIVLRIRLDWKK